MPLIIRDFKCDGCNFISEEIVRPDVCVVPCQFCESPATKILSLSSYDYTKESPEWVKSVREVVNKRGGVHCQNFLKDPTRANYETWKKKEGLRNMDHGENPPTKEELEKKADKSRADIALKVKKKFKDRRAITIESR